MATPQPSMLRHPSAFLPITMSAVAIAMVVTHLSLHGTAPQADETGPARIWQVMIAGQVPIVLFFMVKWVSQRPREAGPVLLLQILTALAAIAPVYALGW